LCPVLYLYWIPRMIPDQVRERDDGCSVFPTSSQLLTNRIHKACMRGIQCHSTREGISWIPRMIPDQVRERDDGCSVLSNVVPRSSLLIEFTKLACEGSSAIPPGRHISWIPRKRYVLKNQGFLGGQANCKQPLSRQGIIL
jgi:uncharacterized protein YbaR (Trm112 family)